MIDRLSQGVAICAAVISIACSTESSGENLARSTATVLRHGDFITSFSYSASSSQFSVSGLGIVNAGVTIHAATCGLAGTATSGDTLLRLVDPQTGETLGENDDACGSLGSSVVYTVPFDRFIGVSKGCWSTSTCSGTVVVTGDHNANGVVDNVMAAFDGIPAARTVAFSTRVNDLYGLTCCSRHLQGIQRVPPTVNPAFAFVFSVSAREDPLFVESYRNNLVYPIALPSRGAVSAGAAIGPNPTGSLSNPPPGDIADRNAASPVFGLVGGVKFNHSGGLFRSGRFLFNPNQIADDTHAHHVFVFDLGAARPTLISDYEPSVNNEALAAMAVAKLQINSFNYANTIPTNYWPPGCSAPKTLANSWIRVVAGNATRHLFFSVKSPNADGWVNIEDNAGWTALNCGTGMWDGLANDNTRFANPGENANWQGYQNLFLLTDPSGNMFLIGGGNSEDGMNPDILDLWQVHFFGQQVGGFGSCNNFICMRKLRSKITQPTDGTHLKWGGGVYIAGPSRMLLYTTEAIAQNGADGYLRMNEFGN
jgi:hypothetical protein